MQSKLTRRTVLGLMAGTVVSAVAASAVRAQSAPAVRKKTELNYWTWSDNPDHQKRLLAAVDGFNKSQDLINVTIDATSRTEELRQKVAVAFSAGAAPDIAGTVQTTVQDWYNSEILSPLDDYFSKWDEKDDYFPSIVKSMHVTDDQPALYLPVATLPYVLYYRADWFDEAGIKPPATYDDFIAAAKTIAQTPGRIGYALRGADYFGTQVIEPIWGSAGVDFVKADGTVDFDSDAARGVTEKWVGMFTKDKSVQPSAVTDGYPELFSLMESGKAGMWIYGAHGFPQLNKALGDKIQAVPTPTAGARNCMLNNPTGNFIVSSSQNKDAAWEFIRYMSSGDVAITLGPERGYMPVRASLAENPVVTNNRVLGIVRKNADNWWNPPFQSENWVNYQNSIAPYWQQVLRQEITVEQYQARAAGLLRGER
ncbi:MAG TPA: sugar ABC transporter substrate-binding protein [Devosiaceae bacterium]|jgi:multiple sugar transport system substrate-binding protein